MIREKQWLWFVVLFVLGCGSAQAANAVYIYRLPDGSHLITDRQYHDGVHRLVRVTRRINDAGRYASTKFHKRNNEKLTRFDALIRRTAARHSVDAALVKAVVHTESYFDPRAKSRKGAQGLMQLMPETAAVYGVANAFDPEQNLEAGVRHLRYLLDKYPTNLSNALAAYNAGESAVHAHDGVPPFPETRQYVRKVLDYQTFYRTWF